MSGLEPLAALGLACNIFQVVSFARDVYQCSKTIYEGHVPESARTLLVRKSESLAKAFDDARRTAEQATATTALSPNDNELLKIAKDCRAAITALADEVNKLEKASSKSKGKLLGSVLMGAKSVVRMKGSKVKELKCQLEVHQSTLETRLLVNIW